MSNSIQIPVLWNKKTSKNFRLKMETLSSSFEGEMSTIKKKKGSRPTGLTLYMEDVRFTYVLEIWSMKTLRKIPHPHLLSSGSFLGSQPRTLFCNFICTLALFCIPCAGKKMPYLYNSCLSVRKQLKPGH